MCEPQEAAVVLRIFQEFASGQAISRLVRRLNEKGIRGCFRQSKGWSPATVSRILANEKYTGRWIWNRTESRRDPKTGRKRTFPKPEAVWIIRQDESLRIVSQDLWERVRRRHAETTVTWPGGKAGRDRPLRRDGWVKHYPNHLLAGAMVCDLCGASIAQVSGKSGGYYGCLGATKGACENRLLVRRTVAERVVVSAVRQKLVSTENLLYVLRRVEEEVRNLYSDVPRTISSKEAELRLEERRLANFVEFIGEGRGSRALATALVTTEGKIAALGEELEGLTKTRDSIFTAPPIEWIEERANRLQELLERQTERSALLLRKLVGTLRLEPIRGDIGRPCYLAKGNLQSLCLIEPTSEPDLGSEAGSNSVRWWRRVELIASLANGEQPD